MPIESLLRLMQGVTGDNIIVLMTYLEYNKLDLSDAPEKFKREKLKECHQNALKYYEAIITLHQEFLKSQMSNIQIASPASKSFADKLKC